MVIFAATLTVTLYAVTDMEYPRLGLLRIENFDHFLIDAYKQMPSLRELVPIVGALPERLSTKPINLRVAAASSSAPKRRECLASMCSRICSTLPTR